MCVCGGGGGGGGMGVYLSSIIPLYEFPPVLCGQYRPGRLLPCIVPLQQGHQTIIKSSAVQNLKEYLWFCYILKTTS